MLAGAILLAALPARLPAQQTNSPVSSAAAKDATDALAALRVGVTNAGFDDIASVLDALEISYRRYSQVQNPFKEFDVLFISCGCSEAGLVDPKGLRSWVEKGGVVYVSDLSHPVLEGAFGDYVRRWQPGGPTGKFPCKVLDPELAKQVGQSIELTFDAGGWMAASQFDSKKVQVLVQAKVPALFGLGGGNASVPVLITFKHGRGRVIYTSFHNHPGANELEAKLIRAIVAAPVKAGLDVKAELVAGVGDPSKLRQRLDQKIAENEPKRKLSLAEIRNKTPQQLVEALPAADAPSQAAILQELHDRKGGEATQALGRAIAALPGDRQESARALLVKRMTRMTANTLRAYLAPDTDRETLLAAVSALKSKGERGLYPELVALLSHKEDRIADAAHAALVELAGKDLGPFAGARSIERLDTINRWKKWLAEHKM
jgi:hypothetical protein